MSINIVSELRTMAGNAPARPAYVTDLYSRAVDEIEALHARIEKAEAERDDLLDQVGAITNAYLDSRNDALEEAAQTVTGLFFKGTGMFVDAAYVYATGAKAIRDIKSSPPPPDGEAA